MTIAAARSPTRWRRSRPGARQIQGTLNGLGERCGNANLVTLIGALKLKDGYADRFELGVSDDGPARTSRTCRGRSTRSSTGQPNRHAPFVGASAFATKAGIHASAVLKDPRTYEHVEPEVVGNVRRVLVSDQGGALERARRAEAHRDRARPGRSARRPGARGGQAQGGGGLRLRGRRRLVLRAGEAPPRRGAAVLRRRALLGQRGAALQRGRRARHRGRGDREGAGRRRGPDLGRRGQRPGQRARRRPAQGPRASTRT